MARPTLAVATLAILGGAACASAQAPTSVTLAGTYIGVDQGKTAAFYFSGSDYTLYRSSPCSIGDGACIEQGTFSVDAVHGVLSLSDAISGHTTAIAFHSLASTSDAEMRSSRLLDAPGLTASGGPLTAASTSSAPAMFSADDETFESAASLVTRQFSQYALLVVPLARTTACESASTSTDLATFASCAGIDASKLPSGAVLTSEIGQFHPEQGAASILTASGPSPDPNDPVPYRYGFIGAGPAGSSATHIAASPAPGNASPPNADAVTLGEEILSGPFTPTPLPSGVTLNWVPSLGVQSITGRDTVDASIAAAFDANLLAQASQPAATSLESLAANWTPASANRTLCPLTNTALTAASAAMPCQPISTFLQGVAQDLAAMWATQPTSLCSYTPAALPSPDTVACGAYEGNALYCVQDNSLSWDDTLLDGDSGRYGIATALILAHEWGHRNQAVQGAITLQGNHAYTIQLELGADCQAGVFSAAEESRYNISPKVLGQAFSLFCSLGDAAGAPWSIPPRTARAPSA